MSRSTKDSFKNLRQVIGSHLLALILLAVTGINTNVAYAGFWDALNDLGDAINNVIDGVTADDDDEEVDGLINKETNEGKEREEVKDYFRGYEGEDDNPLFSHQDKDSDQSADATGNKEAVHASESLGTTQDSHASFAEDSDDGVSSLKNTEANKEEDAEHAGQAAWEKEKAAR
ncbi:hypothetical protein, partial [Sansalvadorimonas verongulae]|uniref:hypothetical protein n=1 Tax=Sansalvadorimonas verongulae TaxID=2172824 RepID=UPI0012BD6672